MNKLTHTDNLQTSLLIVFIVLLSFPFSLVGKLQIDQIQIIGLLVLLVIFYHRFFFPKLALKNHRLALYIEVLPFIFFVPLLILSTGGFLSPLLIVIHLTAVSLAIILNPIAAISFLISSLAVLVMHFLLILHPGPATGITKILSENLPLILVSFLSFIATIPLFSLFSGHEKSQSDWLNYLDKQISTNEAQQQVLLASLNEAIMIVNPKGFVVMMNQKMEELVGFSQIETAGKLYSDVLKLIDNSNQKLAATPLTRVINTGKSLLLKDLKLENPKWGINARAKFSPIRDRKGELLGILIVVTNTTSAAVITQIQNDTLSLALFKFNTLLSSSRSFNATLLEDKSVTGTAHTYADRLLHINQDLIRFADDFLFSVRLSQEEVAISTSEVNLGKMLAELLGSLDTLAQKEKVTHKLTEAKDLIIKTDAALINRALTNILVICTRLSADKTIIALDMVQEGEQLKIFFNFQTEIPDIDIRNLREKFFGGSDLFTALPKANGLEIYLAENIIELLGGNLSIAKNPKDYKQLEFLVEFPMA